MSALVEPPLAIEKAPITKHGSLVKGTYDNQERKCNKDTNPRSHKKDREYREHLRLDLTGDRIVPDEGFLFEDVSRSKKQVVVFRQYTGRC